MHPPQHDLAALARLYQLDSNPEWRALLTTVDYAAAFTFLVLLVPDGAGAELCRAALIERLSKSGRALQDRSPGRIEDWDGVLDGLVRQRVDGAAAVVWVEAAVTDRDPDFDAWLESWRWAATRLNPFRNRLESSLGCVLIFAGCNWLKPVLRECAPDLWSVRSSVIEIEIPKAIGLAPVRSVEPLEQAGDAPNPELALAQVEALRDRPGQELALARVLDRAGSGLMARFEVREAIPLWQEALELRRQFGGTPQEILPSIEHLSVGLCRTGELESAYALMKEGERICRELGDKSGLQRSLGNQAVILRAWGQLDDAMALLKEQERICRDLGDKPGLQRSLGNQALILQDWGQLDDAMALHKEEERICRELGDKSGLQRSLGNQALILQDWGQLDDAIALHKEEERICRDLGDKSGLQASLGNQALILQNWGQLDDAMALHKEEERICRELGDKSGLGASLGNQALILKARGQLDDAMALHKEEERICRELGDKSGLQASLGNQALILKARGQLDDAMALHKEEERICRELGDRSGLARSFFNQASIHRDRQPPDLDSARKLITEALQIFTELGMPGERDQAQRQLDSLN